MSERAERHHERSPLKKEKATESVGGLSTLQLSSVVCSKACPHRGLSSLHLMGVPVRRSEAETSIYPSHDALLLSKCTRESVDLWGLVGPVGI